MPKFNPLRPNSDQSQTSPTKVMSCYGECSMEKLAGDLLLGHKFVKLEILSVIYRVSLWQVGKIDVKIFGPKSLVGYAGFMRIEELAHLWLLF